MLVLGLPRGARTWQLVGGPGAVTAETEALWGVHYLQQAQMYQSAGNKGQKPKPPEYPEGYQEKKSDVERIESNAKAWREKFGKKQAS